MAIINQILVTLIVGYLCMTMGIMYSWPSSVYNLFSSTNTTLDRVMTNTELSLLGSSSSIGAVVITPFSGYLVDLLGRKHFLTLFSIIQLLSWVIVTYSNKVEAILLSTFLTGLSSSIFFVIPLFLCEICQESIRGSMTSGSMTFYAVGMLISYLFGGLLEYEMMNQICLALTVVGVVLIMFVRETPLFLMKKGLEKEAAASIAYYRSLKANSIEVLGELENIKQLLKPSIKNNNPEEEKLKGSEIIEENVSKWTFIMKSRATRRALLVCLVLFTATIFQGLLVVQVYAQPLFTEAVPHMSAMWSSVLFAVVTIVSSFIAAYLVDAIGRRALMVYASLATGICCAILGTQIQFAWGPRWITSVFIYLYCVAYTLGAGIVPYVVYAEAFMPKIKNVASMISIEWAFICSFIVLYIFNPIVTQLGLGPVFYVFAASSFLSVIFCLKYLPETKGLTIDAIQMLFEK